MKTKAFLKKYISVLLAALFAFFCLFENTLSKVDADETETQYTGVLEDLGKDENFNAADYPAIADDYSLQVIQIAESTDKELFIYVYQPSNDTVDLVATCISMHIGYSSNGQGLSPVLYALKLVATDGVFDKYRVKGYVINDEPERYYNLVSIYRGFNELTDTHIVGGTTDEIAYSIGQQWCVYWLNDNLIYEMNTFKTLEVEVVTNGNIEFTSGVTWGNLVGIFERCNSHFIAFNVDEYVIKHIYDADLTYQVRDVSIATGIGLDGSPAYGEYQSVYTTLYDTDTVTYNGGGFLAKTWTWNRISSAEDFVKNYEKQGGILNETTRETLLNSQWVFAFAETEISTYSGTGVFTKSYSDIADVTVLTLHFQDIRGRIYDLGVVSDKTTADNITDGIGNSVQASLDDLFDIITKILALGILGFILIVVLQLLTPIMTLVVQWLWGIIKWALGLLWQAVKALCKVLFWLLALPFKWIATLFKK